MSSYCRVLGFGRGCIEGIAVGIGEAGSCKGCACCTGCGKLAGRGCCIHRANIAVEVEEEEEGKMLRFGAGEVDYLSFF